MIRVANIALALLIALPVVTLAQSERTFRVVCTVQCDEEFLRKQIESYFARELRELSDVEVVDSLQVDYELRTVVLKDLDPHVDSIVLSTIAVNYPDPSFFCDHVPESMKKGCQHILEHYETVLLHIASVTNSERLKNTCQSIVAAFDTDVLNTDREVSKQYPQSTPAH